MATLRDQMNDHVGTVFGQSEHFAESILWRPHGADPFTVFGVVSRYNRSTPIFESGKKFEVTFDFTCSTATISSVTQELDKCDFDGETFIVQSERPGRHGQRTITFVMLDRTNVSPANYHMGG